ncbi:MAG TPA: lipoyl(octanoyl) transferase LipB [Planctomycetota bacterium]|nr:lipoyl(octanoyl) transferase LipB [Planctomycetota bacterium]
MSEPVGERAQFLSASGKPLLEVHRLLRTPYAAAHTLQESLVERRVAGLISDQLLLTEHDPVITVGRGGEEMPETLGGVPVVKVERGGEATYHGPGQLVAYPIVQLEAERRDLHRYLRDLEEVVIRTLAEFGVTGARKIGLTGVWVGGKKICSLGVAVRRWVAWHGFALNLRTDLEVFQSFRPCGLDPGVMTRLSDHVEIPPTNLLFEVLTVKHFCAVFGHQLPPSES